MSINRTKGEQLYMFLNGSPIGCSTDCSLSLSADAIETSRRGQGAWRTFRPGLKTWSMDCSGFYFDGPTPTSFMRGASAIGTKVRVAMSVLERNLVEAGIDLSSVQPSATHTLTGDAVITTCEYSGSKSGMAVYKLSFQGTGPIAPMQ